MVTLILKYADFFKAIGGGVWGQKYKLILFKSICYHEFNAFHGIWKFQPILELWPGKFLESDPFWAKKWLFFGLFWAIKTGIFAFRWPNLPKSNIPMRFSDQRKNIPLSGSKSGENGFFFVKFDVFMTKSRIPENH